MSGFLYYFPGDTKYQRLDEIPAECGLGYLRGSSFTPRGVENHGPDGKHGWIIAPDPNSSEGKLPRVGIYPDKQTWIEVQRTIDGVVKTTHWLGWEKDSPPKPADLERKHLVDGVAVEINEVVWQIPCVHVPITTLPFAFDMGPAGPEFNVPPEYETLCSRAEDWYRCIRGEKETPTFAESFTFAVDLFAVNYRLSGWELGKRSLGLLESRSVMRVIEAALGIPLLKAEEESKKKDAIASPG